MDNMEHDIPDGKYLGKLCKRGHDWNGTGKSLRITENCTCVVCARVAGKDQSRIQREKHPAAVGAALKRSRNKSRDDLADSFVATCLVMKVADVPPELMALKRSQLMLHRSIAERKRNDKARDDSGERSFDGRE